MIKCLIFLFIVIILTQGCIFNSNGGKLPDEVINSQQQNIKHQEEITMTNKGGENISFNTGKLPKNFPSDIPLYPKAEILASIMYNDKHEDVLSLETGDSITEIENFYKKELTGKGWKIEKVFSTDKSGIFSGIKDRRTVSIAITKGAKSKNNIALSITKTE